MHPVIMRQLAADHIREIHAKATDERLARRAAPVAHQAELGQNPQAVRD
jgi:hypothetical protein